MSTTTLDPKTKPAKLFGGKLYRGTFKLMTEHVVTVNGVPLPKRLDLATHSPTGFAWGYLGSGPAQLALAICADHLGDDAKARRIYQTFKLMVTATLVDDGGNPLEEWHLTTEQVAARLRECAKHDDKHPETFELDPEFWLQEEESQASA